MSGVAIGVGAVGLATAAVGFFKEKSAEKTAKQLAANRPKLANSPYTQEQISLAESQLSTGMSAEAKATYEQDMDRSLSTSLQSVLKGGGNPNNVGEIFSSDTQGRQRLALMKDNLRLAGIDRLTRVQDAAQEMKEKQFAINEDAPWKDAAQATAASRQAGENMMWSGIGTAASGAMRGMEGAKSNADYGGAFPVNTPLADTKGATPSPAASVSTINPNSAPSLLDTLLANNPTT